MEKKSKVLLTFRILIVGEVLSYIICAYFGLVGSESLGITNITRETWNIMSIIIVLVIVPITFIILFLLSYLESKL